MKQHWLIDPTPTSELASTVSSDPSARKELIDLMAEIIETIFLAEKAAGDDTNCSGVCKDE